MKRFFSLLFLPILLLVWTGCGGESAAEQKKAAQAAAPPPPPEVRVAKAETRTVERDLSVTGSLLPDESVNLGFEVPGKVQRILVDFGQSVRRGQVIAELDRNELNLQLARTKAALSQALARIGLPPDTENPNPQSTPSIRQAQAQYEDARSKYESASKLVQSGDIARERFTEVEKQLRAREAALEATRDELRTQLASVEGLRADYRLAQKRVADATLYAPFDGAIGAKLVSPGAYLKENTPVVTLVKTNPLRLRCEIPEPAIPNVRIGATLTFTTGAAPGQEFKAVVRQLNPSLDARSRSLEAEARITGPDARLKPGMFVQVNLTVANKAEVVMAPRQAVYTVAGLTKVFVVRNGEVHEIKVTPGQQAGDWIEIPGLNAGDAVAVTNLANLVQGQKVAVKG